MKGNIECEGINISFPAEEPGNQDEMSGAADREEFSKPLDNAEDYRLNNQILNLEYNRHDHGSSLHGVSEVFLQRTSQFCLEH